MKNKKVLFIIFGATGDLAARKLYPALFNLYQKGYLSKCFAVIGTARREWTDAYFQTIVSESVNNLSTDNELIKEFSSHFYYQSHNVKDTNHYHNLSDLAEDLENKYQTQGNRFFYLSMSPNLFSVITNHLNSENLITEEGCNRVIIEKPFGFDYQTSKELNDEITKDFTPDQIYRIDHYLGKEMVQNITDLRFSNPLLAKIWNSQFISNIQITLSEDIGVMDRGGYYDESGALKDMVQNHILQIISLLTMDTPKDLTSKSIIDEKIKVLESINPVSQNDFKDLITRGQYIANNENEKSYRQEDKVDSSSQTETYVAGKIVLNTNALNGTPLYYRTGKHLTSKETRVDIVFKNLDTNFYPDQELLENVLSLHIDPVQEITLQLNSKKEGLETFIQPNLLVQESNSKDSQKATDAYERLLLDILQGEQKHFAQYEEVAASWKYVDSIKEASRYFDDLTFYPINTTGPKEADQLLEKSGHSWIWKG